MIKRIFFMVISVFVIFTSAVSAKTKTTGLSGMQLALDLPSMGGSSPNNLSGTAQGSGAILSTATSAVCGGVVFKTGQNFNVQQGVGVTSVSIKNWGALLQKDPSMAKKLESASTFLVGTDVIRNVNPSGTNNCEFTVQQNKINSFRNKISYSIQLETAYNRLGTPTTRRNSLIDGNYTLNAAGSTKKQYCINLPPIIFSNTAHPNAYLTKTNSNTWTLTNSSKTNVSVPLDFLCAGEYRITTFLNGKFTSYYNHNVTPKYLNKLYDPQALIPQSQKPKTTVTGQSGYGNLVIVK